jgi:catechol 2,3-dioxygenase-like lactoylglutathione lyase family enzyme
VATVTVRYIVDDVEASIDFYRRHLDFQEQMHPAPTFAMLTRGNLRLLLSAPSGQGGGGQSMPDGTPPVPGGWNRFSLEVPDLATTVESLRAAGVHFRNDIVTGVGGRQILLEDPSGNPVELFEPTRPESRAESGRESRGLQRQAAPPHTGMALSKGLPGVVGRDDEPGVPVDGDQQAVGKDRGPRPGAHDRRDPVLPGDDRRV